MDLPECWAIEGDDNVWRGHCTPLRMDYTMKEAPVADEETYEGTPVASFSCYGCGGDLDLHPFKKEATCSR